MGRMYGKGKGIAKSALEHKKIDQVVCSHFIRSHFIRSHFLYNYAEEQDL